MIWIVWEGRREYRSGREGEGVEGITQVEGGEGKDEEGGSATDITSLPDQCVSLCHFRQFLQLLNLILAHLYQ